MTKRYRRPKVKAGEIKAQYGKDEVALYDSDDAAKFAAGISGWVNRKGQFFGKDEHLARWSGATHHK